MHEEATWGGGKIKHWRSTFQMSRIKSSHHHNRIICNLQSLQCTILLTNKLMYWILWSGRSCNTSILQYTEATAGLWHPHFFFFMSYRSFPTSSSFRLCARFIFDLDLPSNMLHTHIFLPFLTETALGSPSSLPLFLSLCTVALTSHNT